MKSEYSVFIGRFQPLTVAHLRIIEEALKQSNKLIIVVGSHRTSLSIKNPWTFVERNNMICSSVNKIFNHDPIIVPVKDYIYNDTMWITSMQNQIANIVGDSKSVKLYGHFKDDSSYYLNYFPQWELIKQPNYYRINATDIRYSLFENKTDWKNKVHESLHHDILSLKQNSRYDDLLSEYNYVKKYKKDWENAPFTPTFITVDAVVVQDGHVLLVRRGKNPGRGKFALPGGFLNTEELIFRSAIRELKEETNIELDTAVIERNFVSTKTFDHPKRSLRGRTVTHAHFFKLESGHPLPRVKGGDDASESLWIPINELATLEEKFFEDHLGIIEYFVYKY